ncbi:MAG: NADH-quinone oxidoreductase subunit J [Alphaproteobacteria bacterium]|nr:MAG: NADH-quinone oxidoreductase subunit J [Alphaproteobacteria bacterium]
MLIFLTCGCIFLFAFLTIALRNPIYNVLCLVLSFFTSAALMIMTGLEVLGLILMIVYVGAIAILFIFMIMMFPHQQGRSSALSWWHIMGVVALLGVCVYAVLRVSPLDLFLTSELTVYELAHSLYENSAFGVLLMGMILFVAMMVVIGLTTLGDYAKNPDVSDNDVLLPQRPRKVKIPPHSGVS